MELVKLLLVVIFLHHIICHEFPNNPKSLEKMFASIKPKNLLPKYEKAEQLKIKSNRVCETQLLLYTNGIKRREMWALKMLDSSSKIPSGILTGNIVDLGMFDECMSVQIEYKNMEIHGRHCMYTLSVESLNITLLHEPTLSICVPSGCDANYINKMLYKTMHDSGYIKEFGITDVAVTCSNVGLKKWSTGSITSLTAIIIFVSFLIICTILDVIQSRESYHFKFFLNLKHFSLLKGMKQILSTKVNPDSITTVHGIRFLSMCWVVLGHQYITSMLDIYTNNDDILNWITSWKSLYILITPFAVDTFFMLSGLLQTYLFLKEMSTKRKFNIFVFYFHRYIRITPPVIVLLVFSMFIFPHMGSGPRWEQFSTHFLADKCQEKWWSFLLYINNYVQPESFCLGHLWYLAVDMQFFWISPLILYPLARKPKLGIIILCLLFVSQIAIPAVIIAFNRYPIGLTNEEGMTQEIAKSMFTNLYTATHARGSSWLVGIFVGYLMATKQSNFNKITVYIGWVTTFVCLAFCTLGQRTFQQIDYVYNIVWETAYGSLSRPLWAIAVGWIVLASFRGHGGPINQFLSLPIFLPLSRISYCIYLIHLVIEGMKVFTARTPSYFSDFNLFNLFLGSFIISIAIGFFFSLFFEAPLLALEKIALRKPRMEKKESKKFLHETNTEKDVASVQN